jgi:tetratricopeptide (TPR) repeat protein
MYKEIGAKLGEANTLQALGDLRVRRDKLDEAEENYLHCLEMYKEIGAKLGEANTWKALGDLRVRRDKLDEAEENYLHCLEMYKEIGEKLGEANAMTGLARLFVLIEDLPKSEDYLKKANDLYVEIADNEGQSYICEIKMLMCLIQQKASESKCEIEDCLSIKRKTENYSETLGWILFYAKHLNKKGLSTEANICLDYSRKFAEQAKSRDLKKMIENFSLT